MTCGRQGGIHDEVYNLQRWTERLVRGRKIFRLSFGKWQMGDAPWQHYSGDFQNRASFLVQLCTCTQASETSDSLIALLNILFKEGNVYRHDLSYLQRWHLCKYKVGP